MDPDQTAPRSSLIWVHIVCNIEHMQMKRETTKVVPGRNRLILIFLGTFILTI